MAFPRKRWLFFALLLALSGCYRPASDSFEPITNPTVQPVAPSDDGAPTSPPADTTLFPATATLPPVTVIQPTALPTQTSAPTDVLSPTVVPTTAPLATPSETPGFITPGVPIGPVEIETATPVVTLTATPSGLITPTALFAENTPCTYTVKPGDNLFRIAVNHNVTLEDLRAANAEVVGDIIQPGQVLQIPGCTVEAASPETPAGPTETTTTGDQIIHTVQGGETLLAIARRYGVTVAAIVEANRLPDPDRLSVGQQLIIPKSE